MLDVSEPGRSQSLGFIPLGWYPNSIRFSADGRKVSALNCEGSAGSRANPRGPSPIPGRPRNLAECVGVIEEHRTYDQAFGAFTRDGECAGDGDQELCRFGEEVTSNHHAIALVLRLPNDHTAGTRLRCVGPMRQRGRCAPASPPLPT